MEPMVLMEGMTNEEALGKEVTVDPKDYVNVDGYTEAQIAQMDLPQWENKEGYYDVIGEDGRYIYMLGETCVIVGYDEAARTVTLTNENTEVDDDYDGAPYRFTIPYEQYQQHFNRRLCACEC